MTDDERAEVESLDDEIASLAEQLSVARKRRRAIKNRARQRKTQ
jgi:hypothetical protein